MAVAELEQAPSRTARWKDISLFLLKYGGRELIDRLHLGHYSVATEPTAAKAEELTADLEKLGPTFVKLGQLLSTRSDLLPDAVIAQLSRLQDHVEPLPFEVIERAIEDELGGRLSKLFLDFDRAPLGSASLAQVHEAVLHNGRRVAVKVQRPGIQPIIAKDLSILEEMAVWIDQKTDIGRRIRFGEIYQEFSKVLQLELDFSNEAQNLLRLRHNLREFPEIIVPEPVLDYCTSRILTMDYVGGQKVTKLSPLARIEVDGARLADALFHAYLKQVFVDGFFHADPHPGNVFLVGNDRIALLDLGMTGQFSPTLRRKLLKFLPAIDRGDPEEVLDLAMDVGEATDTFDKSKLHRDLVDILAKTQGNLQRLNVSGILFDIVRSSSDAGLHMPPEISTFGRTLLHLDRVGRVLDPNFNPNLAIRRHVDEIIEEHMWKDTSPRTFFRSILEGKEFLEQLPRRANRVIDSLLDRQLGFRVDVVAEKELLVSFQKIANRITVGLIIASLIIGASQLMQIDTKFRLFGYPGFAMICFGVALIAGIVLVASIIRSDQAMEKTRRK